MRADMLFANGLQGRHVLAMVVGFFAVVFAVNGFFLYSALSTYTGIVAQEPYRKGLHYNDRIAEADRQSQLGWHEDVAMLPAGRGVSVALRDREGAPVTGLRLAGTIGRPSTNRHDLAMTLQEGAPGQYSAALATLEPGAWIVSLEAQAVAADGQPIRFRARKRLWLKP